MQAQVSIKLCLVAVAGQEELVLQASSCIIKLSSTIRSQKLPRNNWTRTPSSRPQCMRLLWMIYQSGFQARARKNGKAHECCCHFLHCHVGSTAPLLQHWPPQTEKGGPQECPQTASHALLHDLQVACQYEKITLSGGATEDLSWCKINFKERSCWYVSGKVLQPGQTKGWSMACMQLLQLPHKWFMVQHQKWGGDQLYAGLSLDVAIGGFKTYWQGRAHLNFHGVWQ
jgi:hypothetical protein